MKKAEIINLALATLGVAQVGIDLTADELARAGQKLDLMLLDWSGRGLYLGYNAGTDQNADAGVPDSALQAIVDNLALKLAPGYGKQTAGTQIATDARQGYDGLLVTQPIPQMVYPSSLPKGAGNRNGRTYFPTPTATLTTATGADLGIDT